MRVVRALTLIELIVAVTIGALVAVAVVSATTTMSHAHRSVSHRMQRRATARRALATIVADLRNVQRDAMPNRPVIVGTSARGSGQDSIDLLVIDDRPSRREGSESDQQEVSFYLMQRPGQRGPTLMRRQDHELDDYPREGGVATVVAEGVVGLSFEYFAQREWRREWPEDMSRPPEAVRVTVAAVGSDPPTEGDRPEIVTLSTVVAIKTNPPQQSSEAAQGSQPEGLRR